MQPRSYGKWSQEETQKIIQMTRSYKGNVINWRTISENIKGRTSQQCKSFYNSRIRHIEVNLEARTPAELSTNAICNLLNNNVSKSFDVIKKIYYDQILMEVIINSQMIISGNTKFKYNVKILQTIRQVIIQYNQLKQSWIDQIETIGIAEFQQMTIQQHEFIHLQKLLDNSQTSELYCKITELLEQRINDFI
ncbi:SANT/Myb_domain [Hexamita inflata]|uniref:SANT/Myb domain n=1 Tax=Hexamita inflata TaxID=28002 RepID=A0AA86RR24_9EUKA|nr:SANT/Myb domain [Hexamita inflata]